MYERRKPSQLCNFLLVFFPYFCNEVTVSLEPTDSVGILHLITKRVCSYDIIQC